MANIYITSQTNLLVECLRFIITYTRRSQLRDLKVGREQVFGESRK